MSPASRITAAVLLILLPTVILGGVSILTASARGALL
jgi:hypothetical protein